MLNRLFLCLFVSGNVCLRRRFWFKMIRVHYNVFQRDPILPQLFHHGASDFFKETFLFVFGRQEYIAFVALCYEIKNNIEHLNDDDYRE